LLAPFLGFWALDLKARESVAGQLHVVPVSPVNHDAQRNAVGVGKGASLGAELGAVGGIATAFFPRLTAPSSWRHPWLATAS
jgi:hypothetical protein